MNTFPAGGNKPTILIFKNRNRLFLQLLITDVTQWRVILYFDSFVAEPVEVQKAKRNLMSAANESEAPRAGIGKSLLLVNANLG